MEIILLKDVENLGFKDDIVEVKNGYARNYLIPQGFAIMATPAAKKQLEETLRQRAHKEKHLIEEAKKLAEKLQQLDIKIFAKAGKAGKLFGSVNNADLANFFREAGFDIDRKYIIVPGGNVKRLGKYVAKVRLHREVIVDLPFEVVKIEETAPKAKEEKAEEENTQAVEETNTGQAE